NLYAVRISDNVPVRHDVALTVYNKAGALARTPARPTRVHAFGDLTAEESPEEILHPRLYLFASLGNLLFFRHFNFDVDDRGANGPHDRRELILDGLDGRQRQRRGIRCGDLLVCTHV